MKALLVYHSRYGNTKKVAEQISEGLKGIEDIQISIEHVNDVDLTKIDIYDLLLIGSPINLGGPDRAVKKFIKNLSKAPLKGNLYAVFDTYLNEKDRGKAVNKMEKLIIRKIPDVKMVSPGLSIKVSEIEGPIVKDDLNKCREFGEMLIKQI